MLAGAVLAVATVVVTGVGNVPLNDALTSTASVACLAWAATHS